MINYFYFSDLKTLEDLSLTPKKAAGFHLAPGKQKLSIFDDKLPFVCIRFQLVKSSLSIEVLKEFSIMNNLALSKKIEQLREKMITVGMSKGFTSPETVKLSENLDKLINQRMGLLG